MRGDELKRASLSLASGSGPRLGGAPPRVLRSASLRQLQQEDRCRPLPLGLLVCLQSGWSSDCLRGVRMKHGRNAHGDARKGRLEEKSLRSLSVGIGEKGGLWDRLDSLEDVIGVRAAETRAHPVSLKWSLFCSLAAALPSEGVRVHAVGQKEEKEVKERSNYLHFWTDPSSWRYLSGPGPAGLNRSLLLESPSSPQWRRKWSGAQLSLCDPLLSFWGAFFL